MRRAPSPREFHDQKSHWALCGLCQPHMDLPGTEYCYHPSPQLPPVLSFSHLLCRVRVWRVSYLLADAGVGFLKGSRVLPVPEGLGTRHSAASLAAAHSIFLEVCVGIGKSQPPELPCHLLPWCSGTCSEHRVPWNQVSGGERVPQPFSPSAAQGFSQLPLPCGLPRFRELHTIRPSPLAYRVCSVPWSIAPRCQVDSCMRCRG